VGSGEGSRVAKNNNEKKKKEEGKREEQARCIKEECK